MILSVATLLAVAQTPAAMPPAQIGITAPASATIRNDPSSFDLAGFRLGMTEDEVQSAIRKRGMTVKRRSRVVDFETSVRHALNAVDGSGGRDGGRSVLESATLDDSKGGTVHLKLLGWPGGARVSNVTYEVPPGTPAAAWRDMLVAKYGTASGSERVNGDRFDAAWCARAGDCAFDAGQFRLRADVGRDGGTIRLTQPEGTRSRLGDAVATEVARRRRRGTPSL